MSSRGFDQHRFAFREHSADDSPFLIVERDFQELVSEPRRSRRAVGNNLAVVPQFSLSQPAKTLSFHAKTASALICSDQRKATVPSSA